MTFWDEFPGPNAGYVVERYDRYRQNPNAVDAATRAYFANWTPPTELMLKMVVILREAAEELHRGVLHLRERPQVALQHAMRAKKLENRAEGLYREALAELFQQPQVLDIRKGRLIQTLQAIDRAAMVIGNGATGISSIALS